MTYKEYTTEATQLRTALTLGTLTCMQALAGIRELRQAGAWALADVLTDVVKTWHTAYAARLADRRLRII